MAQSSVEQYLSVIVAGRPECAPTSVGRWQALCESCSLDAEVLPSGESPREMNAAIRAARGEFILMTNADVAVSDDVMQFLAARRLQPNRLYTIEATLAPTADEGVQFGSGWFPP